MSAEHANNITLRLEGGKPGTRISIICLPWGFRAQVNGPGIDDDCYHDVRDEEGGREVIARLAQFLFDGRWNDAPPHIVTGPVGKTYLDLTAAIETAITLLQNEG